MKFIIEVKKSKAAVFLEFLRTLSYVKVTEAPVTGENQEKETVLDNLREAIGELEQVKAGKLEDRDALDFLNAV